MKFKTILAYATIFTGMLFLNGRLNAAVESDVVGYSTVKITDKWTLLGVSFFGLSNSETDGDSIKINDFVSGDFSAGDEIHVKRGVSYLFATWNETLGKWCDLGAFGAPSSTESSIVLEKGDGLWLKTPGVGETITELPITLSGRAVINTTATYNCASKYHLMSLPIHSDVSINDASLTWTGFSQGDQIQIPVGGGSYKFAGWNATLGKWCNLGAFGIPSNTESVETIPPYRSVWVVSASETASCSYDSTK